MVAGVNSTVFRPSSSARAGAEAATPTWLTEREKSQPFLLDFPLLYLDESTQGILKSFSVYTDTFLTLSADKWNYFMHTGISFARCGVHISFFSLTSAWCVSPKSSFVRSKYLDLFTNTVCNLFFFSLYLAYLVYIPTLAAYIDRELPKNDTRHFIN